MVANTPQGPRRRKDDPRIDRLMTQLAQLRNDVNTLQRGLQQHEEEGKERSEALAAQLEQIDKTMTAVTIREEEHAELKKDLERLDKEIRGNGEPGLMVKVDRLVQMAGRNEWLLRLTLGTIAVSLIGGLIDLLIHR